MGTIGSIYAEQVAIEEFQRPPRDFEVWVCDLEESYASTRLVIPAKSAAEAESVVAGMISDGRIAGDITEVKEASA